MPTEHSATAEIQVAVMSNDTSPAIESTRGQAAAQLGGEDGLAFVTVKINTVTIVWQRRWTTDDPLPK